eukprot:Colp12_sorted_trinity150504_noHs@16742
MAGQLEDLAQKVERLLKDAAIEEDIRLKRCTVSDLLLILEGSHSSTNTLRALETLKFHPFNTSPEEELSKVASAINHILISHSESIAIVVAALDVYIALVKCKVTQNCLAKRTSNSLEVVLDDFNKILYPIFY